MWTPITISTDSTAETSLHVLRCKIKNSHRAFDVFSKGDGYLSVDIIRRTDPSQSIVETGGSSKNDSTAVHDVNPNAVVMSFSVPWRSRQTGHGMTFGPKASNLDPWGSFKSNLTAENDVVMPISKVAKSAPAKMITTGMPAELMNQKEKKKPMRVKQKSPFLNVNEESARAAKEGPREGPREGHRLLANADVEGPPPARSTQSIQSPAAETPKVSTDMQQQISPKSALSNVIKYAVCATVPPISSKDAFAGIPMLVEFIEHHLLLGVSHIFLGLLYEPRSLQMLAHTKALQEFVSKGHVSISTHSLKGYNGISGMEGMHMDSDFAATLFSNQCFYYAKGYVDYVINMRTNQFLLPLKAALPEMQAFGKASSKRKETRGSDAGTESRQLGQRSGAKSQHEDTDGAEHRQLAMASSKNAKSRMSNHQPTAKVSSGITKNTKDSNALPISSRAHKPTERKRPSKANRLDSRTPRNTHYVAHGMTVLPKALGGVLGAKVGIGMTDSTSTSDHIDVYERMSKVWLKDSFNGTQEVAFSSIFDMESIVISPTTNAYSLCAHDVYRIVSGMSPPRMGDFSAKHVQPAANSGSLSSHMRADQQVDDLGLDLSAVPMTSCVFAGLHNETILVQLSLSSAVAAGYMSYRKPETTKRKGMGPQGVGPPKAAGIVGLAGWVFLYESFRAKLLALTHSSLRDKPAVGNIKKLRTSVHELMWSADPKTTSFPFGTEALRPPFWKRCSAGVSLETLIEDVFTGSH
jgi:hypothetical protein